MDGGAALDMSRDPGEAAVRSVQDAVGRLWIRREDLTQKVFTALLVDVLPFAGELDDRRRRAVEEAVRFEVETILRCVAAGRPMTDAEIGVLVDLGDPSLTATIPLHALHRAHRTVQRSVQWTLRTEIQGLQRPGMTMSRLSGAFMLIESQLTGEIAQRHLAKLSSRPVAKPHEHGAVEALLAGDVQRYRLLLQARRVSITLGPRNVVALIASSSAADDSMVSVVAQKAAAAQTGGAYHPITAMADIGAVLILPTEDSGREASRRAGEWLADAIESVKPDLGVVCGVGRAESGAEGVAASYAQAARLVDLGRNRGPFALVMVFDDALPYLLLNSDLRCAREVVSRTLDPLRRSPQSAELVETLAAYVDSLWTMARAAERLGIHRHTLGARIQRIEEITGLSLEDPSDRLLVELGLKAERLLGTDESHPAAPRRR